MAFGVYIHIPYCIQRCSYCDFATFEQSQILAPEKYFELLRSEIKQLSPFFKNKKIDTIYFGGGTPSLVPASLIVSVLEELTRHGFELDLRREITIEINPATVSEEKLNLYLDVGINRFSIGAQTFNDALLKKIGRRHSAEETRQTISLLKRYNLNFSLDLIFALPNQTLHNLESDLFEALTQEPHHISPYCLTIPESHPLSINRPNEDAQIEMFNLIEQTLCRTGYEQYEISNYCKPGFHSRHNSLYWANEPYWGIGLGAHSYDKQAAWGLRFWNPNTIESYERLISENKNRKERDLQNFLDQNHYEILERHQALTDFCHISLRRAEGLYCSEITDKFGTDVMKKLNPIFIQLQQDTLLIFDAQKKSWRLTKSGRLLSNRVFGALTFMKNELGSSS